MGDNEIWTIAALKQHFETLRQTDLDAVHLANINLTRRLEGFPQLYATRVEFEGMRAALQDLQRTTIQREIYDQRHTALQDLVRKLELGKVNQETFDNFMATYKVDQNNLGIERRTNDVSQAKEKGQHEGQAATWGQIKFSLAIGVTAMTIVIALANFLTGHVH